MSTPFKVGIIGCGNISNAYLKGAQVFPILQVVGVADLDPARAKAKADEFGVTAHTVESLLADPSIELVVNLTVPKVHASVNKAILEAGKHAYTEKPFALDLAEGIEVIELAKKKGLRVGCAPDTFLGGGVQTARKIIDDGTIGEPVAAVANMLGHGPESWHPDPEFFYQYGGGPMLDMGPYYLTALVNLLGPIRRATGSSRSSFAERTIGSGAKAGQKIKVEVPTHYAGAFDFVSGPIANLNISFDVWGHQNPIIEVYGTKGTVRIPDPNTFGGIVEVKLEGEKEWTQIPLTHSDQVCRSIGLADMATAIRNNRPHRASGELALHVLEAMLAVPIASEQGKHYTFQTTVPKPKALPVGLALGELDA
ncbi:Predicted dehydrogenase [Verrucomicrobium sp. GAS474]|uniref:Gfo/Idh/MocA family protein n=1 Tax=Verrucomicrobium sp. GAS474 TaxID=1882831 RepID=UPI00087ADB01|nr:Gfo/Idh/MocA family oxidoreductase [Verrucomicrobium sp. GAS474]SDU20197.1 Predicted dehydrogenase [Verrucomicrobium sp. GAS474]